MRRRDFITLLGGAAPASGLWSLTARTQQPTMPVIGLLGGASPELDAGRLSAFQQGLSETGYVEGRNVAIEYRWAGGQYDRLPALAAELVRGRVNVIAALGGTPSALAAKAATTTIPIVFAVGSDPVSLGLIPSLSRPGGNITGVTQLAVAIGSKRLELLHEIIPQDTIMALLVNPTNPPLAETLSKDLQAAARTLGLQIHVLQASTEHEIDEAFATMDQLRARGLVIGPDSFFISRSEQLAALALRHRVPAIYQYREFTAAGGLVSYGASLTDFYRLAGVYTGRILKGENPADMPVEQAPKVELIINLKTAEQFGITIPPAILLRADEVIE
jgi:putative tryptophan/tyrosine transport system substrate-binding protein